MNFSQTIQVVAQGWCSPHSTTPALKLTSFIIYTIIKNKPFHMEFTDTGYEMTHIRIWDFSDTV